MVIIKHSSPIMVAHTAITTIYIIVIIKFLTCICCYVLLAKIKKGYG